MGLAFKPTAARSCIWTAGRFVCWLRISSRAGRPQYLLVLTADSILGPYAIVRPGLRPFGMDTGDLILSSTRRMGRAIATLSEFIGG